MRRALVVGLLGLSCDRQSTPSQDAPAPRVAASPEASKSAVLATDAPLHEHALLIRISISDNFGSDLERERVIALEDELIESVSAARLGEVDGHEFGGGEAVLFIYGPNADALFSAVEPLLRKSEIAKGAEITRRYGRAEDPSAREVRTNL